MTLYHCLAIISVLPVVLALASIPFRFSQQSKVDLNNPRAQAQTLTGAGERVVYAQKNAWEALLLFTAALFIAFANNVPESAIYQSALIFVLARIAHAIVYLLDWGIVRFLAFGVSFACILHILFVSLF